MIKGNLMIGPLFDKLNGCPEVHYTTKDGVPFYVLTEVAGALRLKSASNAVSVKVNKFMQEPCNADKFDTHHRYNTLVGNWEGVQLFAGSLRTKNALCLRIIRTPSDPRLSPREGLGAMDFNQAEVIYTNTKAYNTLLLIAEDNPDAVRTLCNTWGSIAADGHIPSCGFKPAEASLLSEVPFCEFLSMPIGLYILLCLKVKGGFYYTPCDKPAEEVHMPEAPASHDGVADVVRMLKQAGVQSVQLSFFGPPSSQLRRL